ncbi:S8 family peptidase [Candidatus Nitrotoga sp. 1052]|uniref:S8 family peptidase n=1 Tax=Candidatus Nitrotoga sp. 1052 TaxID=2886964 RepID=UPI001EF579F1|nr:S8 family serine peptidase [Candidatus Nitrotoga sp. 1052]CAH1091447.1 Peptidase S8/S53 subtilisin kexin sedolisin [Candidatus Nitrotoga sp. 1052]
MNIRVCYLIALSLLFSSGTSANEPSINSVPGTNIVENYNALKEKTDRGEKVRVIAKIKNIERGSPRSKIVPQGFIDARDLLESRGMKAQREFPRLGVLVFEVDGHALEGLVKSGIFEKIEEDIPVPPTLMQSIPHIRADLAHNAGFTGSNQAVAILDTGVDPGHPFYSNRLVEEACFSSNTSWSTSLCPNGQNVQSGTNAANDCSRTGISSCDHGTHVAGISAGANGSMSGVAPGANIVAVQVFSAFSASYCGGGVQCLRANTSDIIAALEWVLNDSTTNNIAAINLSLGGGLYTSACDALSGTVTIADLRSAGIATVIASGNNSASNAVSWPGCISAAITTGSTFDSNDSISYFSNSSSLVDILAPGEVITSSIVGGGYGDMAGTSMATPHVTGAFAVMRAVNPSATVGDIEAYLKANGVSVLDARNGLTFPRLDLYKSVTALSDRSTRRSQLNILELMPEED